MKNFYWANIIEDILIVQFCCYLSYGGTAQAANMSQQASRIRFVDIRISYVLCFGTFFITVRFGAADPTYVN